jgi:hypothetical protein
LAPPFDRSVFLNCPFDGDYAAMLQAIAFTVGAMGFIPRLATGDSDNAHARLSRIEAVASTSRYGIHDLSKCISTKRGEFARMNMPFELGVDYGCRQFGSDIQRTKAILVLEQKQRSYLHALSDISGWDIRSHDGDAVRAIRRVRDWLHGKPFATDLRSNQIRVKYATFQGWFTKSEERNGASPDDIREYPNEKIIEAMLSWMQSGEPI